MSDPREDAALAHLRRSREVIERALADRGLVASIVAIADRITGALRAGGKVMLAGNGGSAADAQHIAAELVGRFGFDRAPLAALALTTDTAALTAISNDYSFEQVFERQVRGLGRKGDVFIGLSTSGRSAQCYCSLEGRARTRAHRGWFHQLEGHGDAGALRPRPGRTVGRDGPDPAGSHDCRACHLRTGRARIVQAAAGLMRCRPQTPFPLAGLLPFSTATA